MKTLILASAAVLSLGLGSAFAATTGTQQGQQQVALNAQANGAQSGSFYGQTNDRAFTARGNGAYVGGYEPLPLNSMSGGD
jgi:hypothetical protein